MHSPEKGGYNAGMANAIEIGTLIDRDPGVRGGRPKVAGTGVTILRIVAGINVA